MMLFSQPEKLIFKVLRLSEIGKKNQSEFRKYLKIVTISFTKPDLHKTLKKN